MLNKLTASLAAAGLVLAPIAAIAQADDITVRFDVVDTDNSGDISFVELQAALEGDDDDLTQEDFDRFDTDGSGGLDSEEYEIALTSLGSGDNASPSSSEDDSDDNEEDSDA